METDIPQTPLVIYHGGRCLDGFGAAFSAWMYFAVREEVSAEYVPVRHGEPLPPCEGRDLYFLDFAPKREEMLTICRNARRVTVLDHHITAQKDLAGLEGEFANLEIILDMNRSGCVIAWEYFHEAPVPHLLVHIQDRDLWLREVPASEDVTAALMAHPQEFGLWRRLCESDGMLAELITEGKAINRYRHQLIEQYRSQAVLGIIAGYRVPIVNCPQAIASELLGELACGHPFAAGYTDVGLQRNWSLRADAAGLDVAAVAEGFGGGGHARAAGFKTELPKLLLELTPKSAP